MYMTTFNVPNSLIIALIMYGVAQTIIIGWALIKLYFSNENIKVKMKDHEQVHKDLKKEHESIKEELKKENKELKETLSKMHDTLLKVEQTTSLLMLGKIKTANKENE